MVGSTEAELTKAKVPYEVGVARYREIARGQILGDDSGFFKMLFHREDRRLLGVHIIGTGATELLHIGQAVLGLGGASTTSCRRCSTIRRWPSATRWRRSTRRTNCQCEFGDSRMIRSSSRLGEPRPSRLLVAT